MALFSACSLCRIYAMLGSQLTVFVLRHGFVEGYYLRHSPKMESLHFADCFPLSIAQLFQTCRWELWGFSGMCVQTHGPESLRLLRRETLRKRCPGGREDKRGPVCYMELVGTRPTHVRAPPGAQSLAELRQTYT